MAIVRLRRRVHDRASQAFGCGDSQNDALKEGNPIGLPARHGNPTEAHSTIVFAALAVSLTAAGSNPAGTWC